MSMLKVMLAMAMVMYISTIEIELGSEEDFLRVKNDMLRSQFLRAINWPFTLCDSANSVQMAYVQMANKPALGFNTDITVVGKTLKAFELNKVTIHVSYAGHFLINVDDTNKMPISYNASSPFIYKYSVFIPKYAFSGDYEIQLQFKDQNSAVQHCVQVKMTL